MSNGSESIPERCVHAVDGPDWAGLREPTSWKERAIAAEAENTRLTERLESSYETSDRYNARIGEVLEQAKINEARLLAERDALLAENAQLQVYLSENRRALDDAINVANGNKTARDALQAENENLRRDVTSVKTVADNAVHKMNQERFAKRDAEAERDALQACLDAMTVEWHTTRSVNGTGSRTQVRSVTPWTVVPEGEQQ